MKKIMICAMVGALVMSMGITSFAEGEVSFTTSTAYGTESGDIVVTTVVNNAKPGESYTYLAYDKTKPSLEDDKAIVYVNQIDVPAGNAETVQFSYEAGESTLTTTELLYAGTNVQVNDVPEELDYYTVNVTHNGDAVTTKNILFGDKPIVGMTFDMPLSGVNVTAVTFNGEELGEGSYTSSDARIMVNFNRVDCNDKSESNTLEITTVAKTVTAPEARKAVAFIAPGDTPETSQAKLSVLGKVDPADTDVEYGIIVTTNPTVGTNAELFKVSDTVNVVEYKALGHGTTGLFAVQLIDEATGMLTTTTHYVRTYTAIGDNYSYSGDIITVNAAKSE